MKLRCAFRSKWKTRRSCSSSAIAATDSELANLEIALLAREGNPRQRVVVRLSDPQFAQAVREVFGDGKTVLANGTGNGGTAVSVEGGYRLSGRWPFAGRARRLRARLPTSGRRGTRRR